VAENAACALARTAELLELLDRFETAGVPAVPYKGPPLAVRLYGSAALRQAGDLDLLVPRARVPAARALLAGGGYHARHPHLQASERMLLRKMHHEVFEAPGRGTVELHWAFTRADLAFPWRHEELAPRLQHVALGGRTVPLFADDDLLLVLCVHGAKHRWRRLEWIAGVAELIRTVPEIDWDVTEARARATGSYRILLLGVVLAHDLLAAPVPTRLLERAYAERAVARLAREVWRVLETGQPGLAQDAFYVALRERLRDRLGYAVFRLTTPYDPAEWRVQLIGGVEVPVHATRRAVRIASQALSLSLPFRHPVRSKWPARGTNAAAPSTLTSQ
jgi:hypothetical protein